MRDNGQTEFVKRGTRRPAFGNGGKGRSIHENRNTDHEEVGDVSTHSFPTRTALAAAAVIVGILTLVVLIFVVD